MRDGVARRVERELRAAVELLAIGHDVKFAAEHFVVELERLAGVAGEGNVKRCLHARQCKRKSSGPRLTIARQSPLNTLYST